MRYAALVLLLLLAMPDPSRAGPDLSVPRPDAALPVFVPAAAAETRPEPVDLLALSTKVAGRLDAALAADPLLADRILGLDLDPQAAFAFVRDQIRTEPYAGQMRSPADVLVARAGNDWDKAQLLAEMLRRMGYATRIVAGAPQPVPAGACGARTLDGVTLGIGGLAPDTVQRVVGRAAAAYAALAPLLSPVDPAPLPEAPHYWVQIRRGAAWIDLDPGATANGWGDSPAGPGSPAEPPEPQRIVLTLQVESLVDGQLQLREILRQGIDLPDATSHALLLTFSPTRPGLTAGARTATAILEGQETALPNANAILLVNGIPVVSDPFVLPGVLPGPVPDDASAPAEGPTTGLTLTVVASAPGLPDLVETRVILDLLPWEARQAAAGGASLTADRILPPEPDSTLPAALQSIRQIAVTAGAASAAELAARTIGIIADLPAASDRRAAGVPLPEDLLDPLDLQASRIAFLGEAVLRAIPAERGACLTIDRPRVVIVGMQTGQDISHRWIDWTLDSAGTTGGDAQTLARLMLWHGVLAAGLEREILLTDLGLPSTAVPIDDALTPAGAPTDPMAAADAAAGFARLTGSTSGTWWRIDPATGRTDARGQTGNTIDFMGSGLGGSMGPGLPRYATPGSSVGRAWYLNPEEEAARAQLQRAALRARRIEEALASRDARYARNRGGNEYIMIATMVSIPIAVVLGSYMAAEQIDVMLTWAGL